MSESLVVRRQPTMNDIAKEAGVSKNTVSLVFKNDSQIPRRTAVRIRKIAVRLGYQKNATVARLMATLRASGDPGARATIALLNAHHDKNAFRTHPTIPTYVAGCRRRVAQLGYGVDEIWLHDAALTGTSLHSILRARGIPGVVVVGQRWRAETEPVRSLVFGGSLGYKQNQQRHETEEKETQCGVQSADCA